jgi:hypothetical protein
MKARSSYKTTFLDRHGPDSALVLRALGPAAMAGGLSLAMFGLAGTKLGLSGPALIAFTLVGAFTLSGAAVLAAIKAGRGAGAVMRHVIEGGSSTPYEEQFSQEQALVMQRDYAAALALYEQRIAASPADPRARIAAADLYATQGANPARAAALYREVQRMPALGSGHDVYVSNRLADLYLGPLGAPGRALVELRRLVDRYPGSAVADHARAALATLKADVARD